MELEHRYQRGLKLSQKLTGATSEQVTADTDEVTPDFGRYAVEFVLGELWSRPNLDLKTRSLCVVAALTVLGRQNQLRFHILGALNNGASKEEIIEVLLQMAAYGGFPAAWDGLDTAGEVFKDYKQSK